MFDWLTKGRRIAAARKAELRGDLIRAVVLFGEAGAMDEASRVMIVRGDSEADPRKRVQHYTQAIGAAPPGHANQKLALKKRALLVIAIAGEGAVSATTRHDLLGAAHDLESIGEQEKAAEAYARAGDSESEARALAQAGDVDRLESVLTEQHEKQREERRRQGAFAEIDMLVASGRRREAHQAALLVSKGGPDAHALRPRAAQLEARKVSAPLAKLVVNGKPMWLVLGDEVVIGRTEGALQIASNAVSRRHVAIARAEGGVVARDLGSRNGTLLRGLSLAGAVPIGEGIELRLGREVPVRIAPSPSMEGAVEIDLGGQRYVAPLGVARLPFGAWRVEEGADGWVELVTDDAPPAFLSDRAGDVQLVPRTTLLVGDAIARERGADPVLRVLG